MFIRICINSWYRKVNLLLLMSAHHPYHIEPRTYPNKLQKFYATFCLQHTTSQAPIHVTYHLYSENCVMFTSAEALTDAVDDHFSTSLSLERASYNVKLPKSFHSDSIISVYNYTTRFGVFLWSGCRVWLILHLARLHYWVNVYYQWIKSYLLNHSCGPLMLLSLMCL